MKIKLYRHIYHKDIYLARNWSVVGGSYTTDFYYATQNVFEAITSANREDFERWFNSWVYDNGKSKLKAKITLSKEVEIDGYKGTCRKTFEFPVYEFECVEFVEKGGEDIGKTVFLTREEAEQALKGGAEE